MVATTRSVAGSILETLGPPLGPSPEAHTEPNATTRSSTSSGIRSTTWFVDSSMRTRTCSPESDRTPTHALPSPTAMTPGHGPIGMTAVTWGERTGAEAGAGAGASWRKAGHSRARATAATAAATAAAMTAGSARLRGPRSTRARIDSQAPSSVPMPETRRDNVSRRRSSIPMAEFLSKLVEAAAGLALHGPYGAAHDLGHRPFGKVFVVAQHQARPLAVRQPRHRPPQHISLLDGVGRPRVRSRHPGTEPSLHRQPPQAVLPQVHQDLPEVGAHLVRSERLDPHRGLHERVLREV